MTALKASSGSVLRDHSVGLRGPYEMPEIEPGWLRARHAPPCCPMSQAVETFS